MKTSNGYFEAKKNRLLPFGRKKSYKLVPKIEQPIKYYMINKNMISVI